MGPRPDGRGKGTVGNDGNNGQIASMGPRPDGRGKSQMPTHRLAVNQLQWGRDLMAAERERWGTMVTTAKSLQWGRDRMAAERAKCPHTDWPLTSFNGAAT